MYRGGRPHRGGYHPPPSRGFDPHPGPDRGYHGPPDPYRRPSPRRRYSSPGARDAPRDYRGGGRSTREHGRYSPSPPRGGLPVDHSLVITVGNELTGHPPGHTGPETPYVRDYGAGDPHYNKPYYSPRRSSYDGQSDRGSRRRSVSRGRSRGRSRSPGYPRSKSRPRSRSRSYSRGRSPERAKSRGRSKSRPRGRSYSKSRSRSRSRSGSRSRRQSRARSRGRSRGRSRSVSRSASSGSSSSNGSNRSSRSRHSYSNKRTRPGAEKEDFSELKKARRRKEIQDTLVKPAKSILKKRVDSSETDSPMVAQNSDSPRGNPEGGLSHEAEQILCALTKTIDPDLIASMLGKSSDSGALEQLLGKIQSAKEGGSNLLPHEKGKQELSEILGMIGEAVSQPQNVKKNLTEIEDEEKFLYGDEEVDQDNQVKRADSSFPNMGFPQSHDVHRGERDAFGRAEKDDVSENRQPDRRHSSATPEVEEQLDFPPGVGPQDDKVRKEVEEYEKIQDLLKTIGLDLGVAEISKMAVRTQERLHGKAPVQKTPTRRQSDRKHKSRSRSYSSSSSSGSRSSSRSRSRSFDRSSSRNWKKPVSPEQRSSRSQSQSKNESRPSVTQSAWPTTPPVGPVTQPFPPRPPGLPPHPMPPYPPPGPQGVMPPEYPPHGYDPYGNYIPYMPPRWPMYPPPGMPVPPHGPMDPYRPPKLERPFLKVIETGASEGKGADKKVPSKLDAVASGSQRKALEAKNTASQKQKVIEELDKLNEENVIRKQKKENLLKEVETLRKQQGELLRKKRREKDGHKDPVLIDLGRLQEDTMVQISKLRAEQRESDKKHEELVKVALILGIDYKESKNSGDHVQPTSRSRKESTRSPEKSVASTSHNKVVASKSGASPEKVKSSPPSKSRSLDTAAEQFEYYDAGNHWCKNCNLTSGSLFDFFTHLHNKIHRKTLDPYDRPWAKSESDKKHRGGEKTSKPAKGSEFLIPVRGFFCQLCEEFFGDPICAEAHVTTHAHNEKYKAKMYENPLYEQRRNLDRQAGLESQKNSEHKRKRGGGGDDDDQENVKKPKHSKKGGKKGVEEEGKSHYSKDEDYKSLKDENKLKEERLKYLKDDVYKQKYIEDDERIKIKNEEEERAKYKKEEDERHRFKKEDEYTYKYRKEEVERSRYEEDRYKNKDDERYRYREEDDRNRFRKDDDRDRYSREEEKPRYGREEDVKYKYSREVEEKKSKYKDEEWVKWPKSKWEEGEESNGKYGKKDQKGKAGFCKDDKESTGKPNAKDAKAEPEKPSEPPKVLCGPSPALLAKLRKKNEEGAARSGFGKFSLKKPQKTALEKEAERIAAQFIKEEEESASTVDDDDRDPFTKSVAAAKSIAIKLSGKSVLPPSNEWLAYNENKSSPNLPSPTTPLVIRKSFTGVQNKPMLPNKPPTANESSGPVIGRQTQKPALSADLIFKAFSGEEVQLKKQQGPSSEPVDMFKVSAPLSSSTAASQPVKTTQIKPVSNECVVTLESDVAAPGVPEEEQKLTVVLRPPPQLSSNAKDPSPKTLKAKTLAAGKAKDLFDIFYSGSTTVKSSGSANLGGKQESGFKSPNNDSSSKKAPERNETSSKGKPDGSADLVKEPCKNQNLEVAKCQETPKKQELEVAKSEEAPKNDDSKVQQASEDANLDISEVDEVLMEVHSGDIIQTNNDLKESPVESEGNTLESQGIPLQSQKIPLQSEESPLESQEIPLESEESLFKSQEVPLESEENTLELQAIPMEYEGNTLELQAIPMESEESPLKSQAIPLEPEESPLVTQGILLDSEANPLESEESLFKSQEVPLESEGNPLELQAIHLESEESPLELQAIPLEPEESPLVTQGIPLESEGNTLESQEIPLEPEESPLVTQGIPLESEGNTLELQAIPLEPEESPLVTQGIPLESEGNTPELQAIPLESEESPLVTQQIPLESEANPLESEGNPLESEEAMSFSPLPGSFTEQLNLDTFEFSFEPL